MDSRPLTSLTMKSTEPRFQIYGAQKRTKSPLRVPKRNFALRRSYKKIFADAKVCIFPKFCIDMNYKGSKIILIF